MGCNGGRLWVDADYAPSDVIHMTESEADDYILRSLRAIAGLKTVGGVGDNMFHLVDEEIAGLEAIAKTYPSKGPELVPLVSEWLRIREKLKATRTQSPMSPD